VVELVETPAPAALVVELVETRPRTLRWLRCERSEPRNPSLDAGADDRLRDHRDPSTGVALHRYFGLAD
jgi:hypothetical protein